MPRHYDSPTGDPNLGDESAADLTALQQHIGEWWSEGVVWHEVVSEYVHIDVHLIEASDERPYHTLITTGMSDRPMAAPAAHADCRHCELMLSLPRDWPVAEEAFKEEKNWWPLRHLKQTARFPHTFETWVWHSHTIGNGKELAPVAPGTRFVGFALREPKLCPPGAHSRHIRKGKNVQFFALIPLYEEELRFAWKHGTTSLFKKLDAAGVTELVDVGRPPVVRREDVAAPVNADRRAGFTQRLRRWLRISD